MSSFFFFSNFFDLGYGGSLSCDSRAGRLANFFSVKPISFLEAYRTSGTAIGSEVSSITSSTVADYSGKEGDVVLELSLGLLITSISSSSNILLFALSVRYRSASSTNSKLFSNFYLVRFAFFLVKFSSSLFISFSNSSFCALRPPSI